ncbi:phospholipase [Tepidicaulis sp. LMO-SS28]|uniref:carboxylesterase family protein n=1 Tax=Tepidicaulis sp. LMO-SS28 TaxID=3447455 RepID=UPI003EDE9EE2
MSENEDALMEAITSLIPPLLNALDALSYAGRHLHPPKFAELVDTLGPADQAVADALPRFQAQDWPDHMTRFREQVALAADYTVRAFEGLRAAADAARAGKADGVFQAYRALRQTSKALEALYPVAAILPPVSRFFLEEGDRQNAERAAALSGTAALRDNVGLLHADNEKRQRGGFSLYVPEDFDPAKRYPLVLALHGGSGHGREFIWSWLFHARSHGLIVLSPTSRLDTWPLAGEDHDTPSLMRMLDFVRERWPIDETRMLLTGMSDGGTFTYVSGLEPASPFTHLAPVSAAFHPLLASAADPARMKDMPIYLTHGALDWMFPVDMAREAAAALQGAGAALVYDEIEDLSHTYPREANRRILDWFLS